MRRWLPTILIAVGTVAALPAAELDNESGDKHWSFQPLRKVVVPKAGGDWARNAIDRFIAAKQKAAGITPSQQASPYAQLRRLHFAVTGLPPLPKEVVDVTSKFNDGAYAAAVDRLLRSPHFGERWARYWLDVARFAESAGYEQDHDRPDAWRYRDFVINAFNRDMPYNEFVRLQIAGDQLRPKDADAVLATGFVVAGVENLIQSRKEFVRDRYDKVDDMVRTVSTGLLGLTVGCARCHDHKYDAILQRDYYHMAAAFAGTISQVRSVAKLKAFVATEVPNKRIRMVTLSESFKDVPSVPATVHFLPRGDSSKPAEAMSVGFPKVLLKGKSSAKWTTNVPGRVALARWLTDDRDGAGQLLARVIVNRIWHHYFGRGIVATPSDFGTRGKRPTHPELLDWLAAELIRNQWKLKPIHKLILMSATYRQGQPSRKDNAYLKAQRIDPDNHLLWRRDPQRLDAEAIRDNLLAVAGRLDTRLLGRGSRDANHPRRSIYLTVKRSQLNPVLQLFDAPDALQTVGNRQQTTTATQGLAMLNNPFVNSCAKSFAGRLTKEKHSNAKQMIQSGFLWALGRQPSKAEVKLCSELFRSDNPAALRDLCQMLFCLNEFVYVE